MKKTLSITITFCIMLLNTPTYADDQVVSEYEYEANEGYESCPSPPLGYGSSSAAGSSISMSMVAWGLGLAIVIGIIAGVIHQSTASHSHSSSNSAS